MYSTDYEASLRSCLYTHASTVRLCKRLSHVPTITSERSVVTTELVALSVTCALLLNTYILASARTHSHTHTHNCRPNRQER